MILVLVETDREGAASRSSREAMTFARELSAAGGGVPVDAVVVGDVSDEPARAARGVRRPRPCTTPAATAFDAYAGAGWAAAVVSRAGGRRLGRGDGGRHRRVATRCWPTSPPARASRWPPTSLSFGGLVAVRGDPPGGRRRGAGGDAARPSGPRCSPWPVTPSRRGPPPSRAPPTWSSTRPRSPRPTWWRGWCRREEPRAGPVRRAEVGPGRGRRGPWRRRRRRVRRRARADRAPGRRRSASRGW